MKKKITFLGLMLLPLIWVINLSAQDYNDITEEDTISLLIGKSNYFLLPLPSGSDGYASLAPPALSSEVTFHTAQDSTLIPELKGVFAADSIISVGPSIQFIGVKIIIQIPVNTPANAAYFNDVIIKIRHEVDFGPFIGNRIYYTPSSFNFQLVEYETILWGAETAEGDFNGGMNGWTTNAISSPDPVWVWEDDAKADLGAFSTGTGDLGIQSPSADNGAMVFDSDFYDNNGDENNMGGGIAPAPQLSELISPVVDLSGVTSGIAVEFNQYLRQFSSIFALSYSMNGGASWSDFIFLNEGVPANEQTERFDVQTVPLAGATGSDQFQIKFIISGNYYFWIIDDVKLLEKDFVSNEEVAWGDEPEQGDFNNGLNDWISNAISDPNAEWVWEADGKADLGAYSEGSGELGIFSATVFNGAAVFDSDYYDNDGIQGNFGNGIAPAPQVSELISPIIDLSGIPYQLTLKFHQFFRQLESNTSVAFSMDGGSTWSSPINLNSSIPLNEQTSRTDIQYVPLIGAIGTSEFRVKFIMEGNYYFWIVDDVKILFDSSISLLPATPSLISPADETFEEPINTSLTWNSVSNADSYSVQVDTEMDFSAPLVFNDNVTTNSSSTPQLDYNTTYYWRVNAVNLAGESDWSEVWSFTTEMMTGVEERQSKYELNLYPNPATNSVFIEFTSPINSEARLVIFNSMGSIVTSMDKNILSGKNLIEVDLSKFPSGTYHYQIIGGELCLFGKFTSIK